MPRLSHIRLFHTLPFSNLPTYRECFIIQSERLRERKNKNFEQEYLDNEETKTTKSSDLRGNEPGKSPSSIGRSHHNDIFTLEDFRSFMRIW